MNILKLGKNPGTQKYIKRCRNCKSLLVYDDSDLFPDMEMDLCIKCPVCEKILLIGLFPRKYKPEKHGKIKNEIGFRKEL